MKRATLVALAVALAALAFAGLAAGATPAPKPAPPATGTASPSPEAAPAPAGEAKAAEAGTPAAAPAAADTAARQVIAYYFHTTARCASCRKIEAYSHEAIEQGFATELADGRLVWRMVNVDEEGNEHFMEDYQLFTKSLVLVEQANGKQLRWKNLPKVWELLPQKERFVAYVQGEVRAYLAVQP